jgi:hypothetical protein
MKVVLWLSPLFTNVSVQRPRLGARQVHVGYVVDRLVLGQVLSEYFCFSLSLSFHQCSILKCY